MELSNPFIVDALWLTIAFVAGLSAKRMGLPPLVGFLLAGFVINISGLYDREMKSYIDLMSDIGVMLLLFTIGLKLKIKSLLKKEIWLTASLHLIISVLAISGIIFLLSFLGLWLLFNADWHTGLIISFALSFSSTVFVVKTLESVGEMNSYHGKIAIGILVIQDIFAVVFLAFSDKKLPSLWILILPILIWLFHKILSYMLRKIEHGEMVTVFGFFATFIPGAFTFYLVGLKPDLGALAMGMILVNHEKADELYNRMSEYKDFFLIAFFINVGLLGLPDEHIMIMTLILLPIMFLKGFLYLFMLGKSSLQPRTAYLTSLSLTNFSEFGLIVGVVGMNAGWIDKDWVIVLALLMSFSFIIAAPLNEKRHIIFNRFKKIILKLNDVDMTEDDEPETFGDAEILVVGLGSVGAHTFKLLNKKYPGKVTGLDYNHEKIERLHKKDYSVHFADTTDSELWENVDMSKIKAIFLTISDYSSNINTLRELEKIKDKHYKVFVIGHYADQIRKYQSFDVDYIYDYKQNLGYDFVDNALHNQPIFPKVHN